MSRPLKTRPGFMADGARSGRIQSIDRAVSLLQEIAVLPMGEATLQRIADEVGLNHSTAWRILATLEDRGMVERRDGAYAIGLAAAQFSSGASIDRFVRRGHSVIAQLAGASGETANLAVVRRFGLYYVDEVSASLDPKEDWIGRKIPVHATSDGKAYLSALPDEEILDLLPQRLSRHTRNTFVRRDALLEEVHEIRARGYATCVGELLPDTNGVAAALCDAGGRPVAAVCVWGPADRIPRSRFASLGVLVMTGAAELEARISKPLGEG